MINNNQSPAESAKFQQKKSKSMRQLIAGQLETESDKRDVTAPLCGSQQVHATAAGKMGMA